MNDPRVRKDGRCARRGCTRMRPIVALKGKQLRELKRYAGNQAEKDPWCSTECCKHFLRRQISVKIARFGWRLWIRVRGHWIGFP